MTRVLLGVVVVWCLIAATGIVATGMLPWLFLAILLVGMGGWLASRVQLASETDAMRAADKQMADAIAPVPEQEPLAETSLPLSGEVAIKYVSAGGEETDRIVTLKSSTGIRTQSGQFVPTRIHTYCHSAHAARTFVLSHILAAHDPHTGEVISDISAWVRQRAGTRQ